MSLRHHLAIDPEAIGVLAAALEEAWNSLRTAGSSLAAPTNEATTRVMLARRIVAMAKRGETDRIRLRDGALCGFLVHSTNLTTEPHRAGRP